MQYVDCYCRPRFWKFSYPLNLRNFHATIFLQLTFDLKSGIAPQLLLNTFSLNRDVCLPVAVYMSFHLREHQRNKIEKICIYITFLIFPILICVLRECSFNYFKTMKSGELTTSHTTGMRREFAQNAMFVGLHGSRCFRRVSRKGNDF